MHVNALVAVLLAAQAPPAQAPAAPAPAPAQPPERRDTAALDAALRALAERNPSATVSVPWTSAGGRPVHLLRLADPAGDPDARPGILVVAGMAGERWSTTEAALLAADALLAGHADLLRDVTFYVVPRANPDSAERFLAGPRQSNSRNDLQRDDDRDGRIDEDGPRDLDGDGVVAQMRIERPKAPWPEADRVPDPAEPRLMRAPDAAEGQRASHLVVTEGVDADGDGAVAEDPAGGIDPDRNFPHRWPEFAPDAGAYPLCVPESRGLADFVIAHPNLIAALVLGRHDTAVARPDGKGKTPGGMPEMLDPKDVDQYAGLAKAWCDATGQKRAEGSDAAGSLVAWLNAQRGLPTVAATLWGRPDVEGEEEGAKKPDPPKPVPADAEAARWLRRSDALGGTGFVAWHPFEHPQLGAVEIGGWVAGFRENPPPAEVAALGGRCAEFLARAAAMRPAVTLRDAVATELAPGLLRVDATLANDGRLPTAMRGGRAPGIAPAHVVRISVPVERVRSGRPVQVVRGLDAGQSMRLSWIVSVAADEPVELRLTHGPRPMQSVRLRGGNAP
jgi:hypothetical protein